MRQLTHSLILLGAILLNSMMTATADTRLETASQDDVPTLNKSDQQPTAYPDYQLKDFDEDEFGYLRNTGSDSFLIINNLDLTRQQACNLHLEMHFQEALFRPAVFEVFWAINNHGFMESQKGFFIINQAHTAATHSFVVPLCKLYHFSGNLNRPDYQRNITGLRLDYPGNKFVSVKFNTIELLSNEQAKQLFEQNKDAIKVEPYERVAARAFTSLDAILPKLVFTFEDGLARLSVDKGFLITWLLLIAGLLFLLLRSFRRS